MSSCSDLTTGVPSGTPQSASFGTSLPEPPGEAHFQQISRQAAEFAGYYYDSDRNLVVNVTSEDPGNIIRALADSIWIADAKYFASVPRGAVRFRSVPYPFHQLASWRNLGLDAFFRVRGVNSLDLDEAGNVITVGVDPESLQELEASVRSVATGLGIPSAALVVEPSGPLVFDAATLNRSHTLRDLQRPVQAGFQVSYFRNGDQIACTIGWVTYDDWVPVIVSASHCSAMEGVVDNGTFYQQQAWSAIGTEIKEAYPYTCSGVPCHFGDVNVIELHGGITFDAHVIGRPSSGVFINHSKPTITLVEEYHHSTVGISVGQIGRTSGWKNGTVKATCVHYQGGTSWISMCLDRASYGSDFGDSGAPVFTLINDAASTGRLAGIHSGRQLQASCVCYHGLFTPMNVLYGEFFDLQPLPQ